jgi:glycosyltransferase involved in cell wall biosynthesis
VLEAMTVGVPVVAADAGALPEVAGGAALLVDPHAPSTIAAAIAQLLDDPDTAAACTERGIDRARTYSWERTAGATIRAYQAALTHRAARGAR